MKIAIPTREENVDNHFGHCDHYTVFTIEQNEVKDKSRLASPQGCGCKSNIASILEFMGVELMLAGSMGDGAKQVLEAHHIRVIRGCSGHIDELVKNFLDGKISDSGMGCSAHGAEHHCEHVN